MLRAGEAASFSGLTLDLLRTAGPESCHFKLTWTETDSLHLQARLRKTHSSLSCLRNSLRWVYWLSIDDRRIVTASNEVVARPLLGHAGLISTSRVESGFHWRNSHSKGRVELLIQTYAEQGVVDD